MTRATPYPGPAPYAGPAPRTSALTSSANFAKFSLNILASLAAAAS